MLREAIHKIDLTSKSRGPAIISMSVCLLFIGLAILLYVIYPYSPTTCTAKYYRLSLLKKNDTFLIHGLWIEQCEECPTCGYPSFCESACKFNISKLAPIYDRIQENWFPGENPLNNSLLSHEWCKHGSCTNMTELAYFNMTLGLYDELVANDLLSLCNQRSKGYFIVNQNFTITNTTMDLSKKDRSNAHKECEDHSLLISSPAGCS